MPIEIKEIVVKAHIDSGTAPTTGAIDAAALKEMMEKLKEEILSEVSGSIFNQIRKNNER